MEVEAPSGDSSASRTTECIITNPAQDDGGHLEVVMPTPDEVECAHFTARTPHYVLSRTLTSALWPRTSFLRGIDDVAALKQQPGKDIYLVGGARTTASLLDAGLVDELRLIVHPLIAGKGKPLFATTEHRRGLELRNLQQLQSGRVGLTYSIT
jgi:dihydrofolate reductase